MKRSIFLALALLGFLISPSFKALAQAIVTDVHLEQYVNDETSICNGTELTIQGHRVIDVHIVTNKNRVHISFHVNGTYTAVDAEGNTYIAQENVNVSRGIALTKGATTVNEVSMIRFISQGSAPNLSVRSTSKLTFNAKGELVVERENFTNSCD